jgi:CHAT domain-containing protein/O-acetyl-ADP-ribose deacetylase (regulator of RNase III)
VFSTFAGLVQMLPFRAKFTEVDLYDVATWPEADQGLVPRADLLAAANEAQSGLGEGQDNFFMIAGVEQKTVVGLQITETAGKREFVYEYSMEGDGTVPLNLAQLPGVKSTYYVIESHGSLPNNKVVSDAVIDLLESGETALLPNVYGGARGQRSIELVPEHELRRDPYEGRRSGILSQRELRDLLVEVAAPTASDTVPATEQSAVGAPPTPVAMPGFHHPFDRVVVGRRRQHRIDLRFAYGSITDADSRAVALGIYKGVAPGGPANALDARMGGAIAELHRRRMFSGNVGEIFVLPTGRHPIAADFVTFVGLGTFDRMTDDVLQTAAENVVRTFVNTRIEEFSTVLFGGGSGGSAASSLGSLLSGFFRGLRDADKDHHFRRIVLCEYDRDRYMAVKEEMYRLSSTDLCRDVEITFDEVQLRPTVQVETRTGGRDVRRKEPVYLIVRQENADERRLDIRSSLLTAGSKATVITGIQTLDHDTFRKACRKVIDHKQVDFSVPGAALADAVLAEQVRTVLPRFRDNHLVIVHDAPLSRIPWEAISLNDANGGAWNPSSEAGLSHRYAADNLSVAKWLEERLDDHQFNMLLVVDPTDDLSGAEAEGRRIREMFAGRRGVQIKELRKNQATRPALLSAFSSGEFDVIHYAGHAFFDERNPGQSGLVCHNEEILTGTDLMALSRLPALVFFNACEAGRVRGRSRSAEKKTPAISRSKYLADSVGAAEAFMRGGLANFLGTYWPVGDEAAEKFATQFYQRILAGGTIGEAILTGRQEVRKLGSRDWANYLYYGNADFVLKELEPSG